jgi:hypothetical protein
MPTVSKKQEKFMQAVANNPKFAKKVGVPVTVGQEFTKSGGGMKKTVKKMALGGVGGMTKTPFGSVGGMRKVSNAAPPKGVSGALAAYAKPNALSNKLANMKQPQGNNPAAQKQFMSDMARAGKPVGLGKAMPKSTGVGMGMAAKKLAGAGAGMAKAVMGKKAGGLAAGHKQADGIAKKGKTRAIQVKMAGGGKTKKYC